MAPNDGASLKVVDFMKWGAALDLKWDIGGAGRLHVLRQPQRRNGWTGQRGAVHGPGVSVSNPWIMEDRLRMGTMEFSCKHM